jgi:hypothetical protein
MNKIYRTWSLMSASWQLFKEDKKILVLPLMSGLSCLAVIAAFAIPLFVTGNWRPPGHDSDQMRKVLYYGTLFVFYYCNYFVIVFFNAALISCVMTRMCGGQPSIAEGLKTAGARLPLIAGWALIAATVGLILRVIEDRSDKIGRIVAGLLGMGWTVVTYFVVPIMVIERRNPFAAVKESTVLLKRTWGEQLVGGFSFSAIFGLLALPAMLLVVGVFFTGNPVAIGAGIGIAVLYIILLALIQSALQSIFQTAVYLYARNNEVPAGFQEELLRNAVVTRS